MLGLLAGATMPSNCYNLVSCEFNLKIDTITYVYSAQIYHCSVLTTKYLSTYFLWSIYPILDLLFFSFNILIFHYTANILLGSLI